MSVCTQSFCPSAWKKSAPPRRIFIKFDMWELFEKSVEKIQISLQYDKNNRYFTGRQTYIFDHISLNSD